MMGYKIQQLRKSRGMSQEQLSAQLTVSRQAISKWELGEAKPDTDNIMQLCKLFRVSSDYLLDDNIEISNENANVSSAQSQIEENAGVKIKPYLTIIIIMCSIAHFVLGILGYVNLVAVVTVPLLCMFISLITYAVFSSMIKTNNYDMLAGYDKKKDNIRTTQLQMYWGKLFSDINAVIFEVLFALIYFISPAKQMDFATILLFVFISIEAICFITVSAKIKSQGK